MPTITDEINTPSPGRPGKVRANPLREYVAGGSWSPFLGQFYEALPRYVDDVEREVGDDTYDRMQRDAEVFSSLNILKQAVLSQEAQVVPRVGEAEEGAAQAKELADFCRRCVGRLPHFRNKTLYGLLDALPYGHKLAEQVYERETAGPDTGKLVPKAIKLKPRKSYALIVDAFLNVVGVQALVPGQYGSSLTSGGIYGNPASLPNIYPRSKFVILSLLERDSDPRGVSWLRAAYNPWYLKTQVWPEHLKYLMQFASPSLIGTTSEGSQRMPYLNPDGTVATDADGNTIYIEPEQALLNSLLSFKNGTALAVPFGTKIDTIFEWTSGEGFRFAVDLYNSEIGRSITFQTLATQEAQFGSRAASQTHQDILDLPIQFIRTSLEETIERDMFARWVELNWGPEYLQWVPKCQLGDTSEENFNQKASAVAALFKAGYIDESQLADIDARLGLPHRSEEELEARRQQKAAGLAGAQALAESAASGKSQAAGSADGEEDQGDGEEAASDASE